MEIAIALLLVAAVGVAVAYPIWRPPLLPLDEAAGPSSKLAALEERKAALYGAIREVGFDFRMDKLTAEDYRQESETLKQQAIGLVAEIEAMRARVPRGDDAVEERIAAVRAALGAAAGPDDEATRFCTRCGVAAAAEHRFCGGCGAELGGAA